MKRGTSRTGDGDICPVIREHGHMLVLNGNKTQYCPDQSHDGRPGKNGTKPTRKLWPFQFFDKAVAEYNERNSGEAAKALPDIDMEGF